MSDVDGDIKEVNQLLSDITEIAAHIRITIASDTDKLNDLKHELKAHEVLISEAQDKSKLAKAQNALDKKDLEDELVPLRQEKQRLATEVSGFVTKKANYQLENARLYDENTKFKTYEEKAWKVLKAKESELLEREQAVQQRESLRPTAKTLLPPTDML